MSKIPILILSDSVTGKSGLGRIARELALHIATKMGEVFEVGVLGIGGSISNSYQLPFRNWTEMNLRQMVFGSLPQIWEDFAGYGEDGRLRKGVCLSILNASWSGWISHPEGLPDGDPVKDFLLRRPMTMSQQDWASLSPAMRRKFADFPFERWLYCPVDGHCPDGTMGWQMADILTGFDRVLAYTEYGAGVIEDTLGRWSDEGCGIEHLPHGINPVFFPRDRKLARQTFISRVTNGASSLGIMDDMVLCNCVATNTPRKDWGLVFETVAELRSRGVNAFLWGHTDTTKAHWDIPAMVRQFGLEGRVVITTDRLSDEAMAWAYSACDVMLATASEGWGLTASEALGSGLPVIHMTYAGGSDFVPKEWQMEPCGYYQDGRYMIRRPTFKTEDWADCVERILADEGRQQKALEAAAPLKWSAIWDGWQQWLSKGIL